MAVDCRRCQAGLSPGARFCGSCGAAVAGCPSCGEPVPDGARFCPSCGAAIAADARSEERKVVSVLFADLVGSTAIAEGRDPERVARILDRYATAMREVLESWGGTVEKYIGDAVVAAFGVPTAHEDDAARAVQAALEMQGRLEALNDELERDHGLRLEIRIGVDSGPVLAATAGRLDQRFLAGDVVNTAARLQQAAEPGTILVAGRTSEAAGGSFVFDAPVDLALKGKSEMLTARRLLGIAADRERPEGSQARLVGRDDELGELDRLLDAAVATESPRLGLVLGPAGIGKSRLAREFLDRARNRRPGLRVLRGRCRSSGQGITYWALGEIVRQACSISLDDTTEVAGDKLGRTMVSLFDHGSADADRRVAETRDALAITAGIRLADNPLAKVRPIVVADAMSVAWPRFASAEARREPTVLFVEDLHWADDQLVAILEAVQGRAEGPLLVLATARPEFAEDRPAFAAGEDATTTINLRALDASEEERMIEELLGWGGMPAVLRGALLERAEGNPFFLEQLVGGLVDSGVLVRADEGWRATTTEVGASLPDTVHGVLAARIDRLSGSEKLTLQEAAVVGRTFWAPAVRLSVEPETVPPALDGLEAKGLIFRRPSSTVAGEREYLFKHALVRDVAYGGIPLARRARSHARVAAWLEDLGAGDDGVIELVAYHYRTALLGEGADLAWTDDPIARTHVRDRAFEALMAAGAVVRQRNVTDRALELHETALGLAADDRERARAYEELGDDHGWSYHGDPSVEAWTRSLELWRALGDDEARARICLKAARHCAMYWGGFASRPTGPTIDRLVDEGLEHARDPRDRAWLLALSALASGTYAALGERDDRPLASRVTAAEESAAIASELGDADLRSLALRSLGGLYLELGEPARSLEMAERQLAMMDRVVVKRDRLVHQSMALARVMDIGGDFERALDLAEQTRIDSRTESAHERMHATYFVMAALYRLGRLDQIPPLVDEHLASFTEETVDMNCPFTRSGPAVGALALDLLGRSEEALVAERSIFPDPARPGLVEAWVAERALRVGDNARAREVAEATLAFGRRATIEEPPYELPVFVEALADAADWEALDGAIATARDRSQFLVWLAPAIDRAEAARLAADGDRAGAGAALDRALAAYRRLGMLAEVARTEERLEALG